MGRIKRIGILGGTFNPPHFGHMLLAQEALRKLRLEKIVFIPAAVPPHKKVKDNNAYLRYRMTVLSCKGNPRFEVSKIELERRNISYSIDTLSSLKSKYGKNVRLFFIAGSDSLRELKTWKNAGRILKLATFVVARRPGFPIKRSSAKVKFIDIPAVDISSCIIRKRVRFSEPIRYFVSEPVRKFIVKNRLYR